jgi:hypothetical protein
MVPRSGIFRPGRSDWLEAGLVALVLFALYAITAPRTVATEDDGLFILSSYFLGVEHPPGYPLYTLLGKLFTLLPFGSVAYRVHLLSGLFGALTGAAAWLCARALIEARLAAYLAALGLGFSPVFWSQALIAEVYTFNTFFFLVLVYLGLQLCPPGPQPAPGEGRRILPWMALVFGLSLSNHWPLMLLVAPAFVILLRPRIGEILRRSPLLAGLFVLGLLPYAWMVLLSWTGLPISFYGSIETLGALWFMVSRSGYAGVDHSLSATVLDRIKFFQFAGGQLLLQFALVGTSLAGVGFAVQWRHWGRRVSAFLTVAFLMPTAVLLLLLGFDYDSFNKHVFHVYPLPAYAVVALWMALGFAWLARRMALRRIPAFAGGVAVLALIFALGCRSNLLADYEWTARYALAVLRVLPRDAIVFAKGDPDLVPIAYFHMIEHWRPDITLYQAQGLVLGNRLFHPLHTDAETQKRKVRDFIEQERQPVVFTMEFFTGYARRERWLYSEIDKSSSDASRVTVDIPEEASRAADELIFGPKLDNAWAAFVQGELRRTYGSLLGRSLPRTGPRDPRAKRHLALLSQDFTGALGVAEGLMANPQGYSAEAVSGMLERARDLAPSDVNKEHQSRFFQLRGALRLDAGDKRGATADFETALMLWPSSKNLATTALEDLYRAAGDEQALRAVQDRVKRSRL